MSEQLGEREKLLTNEWRNLMEVVNEYLGVEDKEFIETLDMNDALGYVYGKLIQDGYDPDEVLKVVGVTVDEV